MATISKELTDKDRNEDPLTGEPGAHPAGAGLGAAGGGAAAGVAAGAVAGPLGAAAGAVVGGIAGGLAGKAIAEQIDPTEEHAYWEENYRDRDYVTGDPDYDEYGPAYQYGWEARTRCETDNFDEVEADLARDWETQRGASKLEWEAACPATRDAWDRTVNRYCQKR